MADYDRCVRERRVHCGADLRTRSRTNRLLGLPPNAGFMVGGAHFVTREGEEATICWPKYEDYEHRWINSQEEYGEDIGRGFRAVLTYSERNLDEEVNQEHIERVINTPAERIRYVFWREELHNHRWYKFYGKFQLDEDATRRENKCIFRRIASEVPTNLAV